MKPGMLAICTSNNINIDSLTGQESDWISGIIPIDNAKATDVEIAARRYFGVKLIIDSSVRDKICQLKIQPKVPVDKFIKDYAKATNLKDTIINNIYYIK